MSRTLERMDGWMGMPRAAVVVVVRGASEISRLVHPSFLYIGC